MRYGASLTYKFFIFSSVIDRKFLEVAKLLVDFNAP